jgi:hypothetical protein
MKVSVLVPLYNKAPYVRRALDSILAQTLADFEIIVVDDGSTDGGVDHIVAYSDPRIRIFRQANAGPGAARNRGLAEARADYVAFLDADDEWLPTFLEKSVAVLEQHGSAAAVASGYVLDPAGVSTENLWRRRRLSAGLYRIGADWSPLRVVHLLAYLATWNTVARTAVLRRWGGFFSRERCLYGEDSFLWLKVLLNETVAVQMEPLVRYHTEASALAYNLEKPRPLEPLLLFPEELEDACPEELQDLLSEVLAIRAAKSACMLGSWGRWRQGRALLGRFGLMHACRMPIFLVAQAAVSPLAALAGIVWRSFRRRLDKGRPRQSAARLAGPGAPFPADSARRYGAITLQNRSGGHLS